MDGCRAPPPAVLYRNAVPFKHFAELVHTLGSAKARPAARSAKTRARSEKDSTTPNALKLFIQTGREALARVDSMDGFVVLFFRLFFPEEGARRRYDLREQKLAQILSKLLGLRDGHFIDACVATSQTGTVTHSGCLGEQVRLYMEGKIRGFRGSGSREQEEITLGRVDQLLDELAALSQWSAKEVRDLRVTGGYVHRTQDAILSDLLRGLAPSEVSVIVQIIIRDLSPLLYPPPTPNATASLVNYNSAAYTIVTVEDALRYWAPDARSLYCAVADLDRVAWLVDVHLPALLRAIKAALGIPLDLTDGPTDEPLWPYFASGASNRNPPRKAILEGEMVPWDEETQSVAEFWRLGYAKLDSPVEVGEEGFPSARRNVAAVAAESFETGQTGATPSPMRSKASEREEGAGGAFGGQRKPGLHLMIVWFDCLLVDDRSLLNETYEERRKALCHLVCEIPGYSMVAEQHVIDFSNRCGALPALRERFAQIIVNRSEGLMLKPFTSLYNDWRRGAKWIKLKKDFIPGAGDTLDFHLVGASYTAKRARELLVPPSVLTTFFVGVAAPEHGAKRSARDNKKHFHILFSVSYGLSREELAVFNSSIRQAPYDRFEYPQMQCSESPFTYVGMSGPQDEYPVYDGACTSFTFSLAKHLRGNAVRPQLIFRQARVAELNGAGFQKSFDSPYYELRWPRFTKSDRSDGSGEPVSLAELQRVAERAVGVSQPAVVRLVEHLFDLGMEGARYRDRRDSSDEDRAAREREMWVRRLEEADRVRRPGVESTARRSKRSDGVAVDSGTATTSLLRATFMISSAAPPPSRRRQSTPPALPPPPIEKGQIEAQEDARDAAAVVQVKTPARRPPASPMKRSYSSPAQRSDAPSPSQRGSDGLLVSESDVSGGLDRIPPCECDVAVDRAKRRRVTGPEGHVGPRLGHRATLPAILPSFPRPFPGDAALTRSSSDPTTFAVWTLVPPPPNGRPHRTPCHASLDRSNYVETPWEVLRAAGHAVKTDSDAASESPPPPPTTTSSSRRLGYIFVAEECEREFLTHLRKKGLEREESGSGRTVLKPVLVLTMTAFHRGFSFASARVQHLILASV
ncbi:hypothetical protein B0A53_05411 [Rhodotorula sp. CCFEE 5036]|nr:hypothetical protein B0A53_05411 [Rhodotorula sp. CCFEE 5036]